MMATALAEPRNNLLFKWGARRRRKRSIVTFVIASVVVHAFAFYLFQIVYPPTVALLPPPARVGVISPTTEEGRQLLHWVEAEDPAVASMTQRPADVKAFMPPKVQHIPSYVGYQPALKPLPPSQPDLHVPSAHPPGPIILPHPRVPSAEIEAPTAIRFSPELEAFGAPQFPEMHFTRAGQESPQAALFRVAVSSAGEVRYSVLERPSGDSALDEQARLALALCRFPSGQNGDLKIQNDLVWGTASVQWGNDVAPPPKPSAPGRKTP